MRFCRHGRRGSVAPLHVLTTSPPRNLANREPRVNPFGTLARPDCRGCPSQLEGSCQLWGAREFAQTWEAGRYDSSIGRGLGTLRTPKAEQVLRGRQRDWRTARWCVEVKSEVIRL